jgi:hypothetical protein
VRTKLLMLLLMTVVLVFADVSVAGANVPLTRSRPWQKVCERQGGTFSVAVDSRSLYCNKVGAPFTAFSPRQLATQRRVCEGIYRAFFGVQSFEVDGVTGTGTFCSTA